MTIVLYISGAACALYAGFVFVIGGLGGNDWARKSERQTWVSLCLAAALFMAGLFSGLEPT